MRTIPQSWGESKGGIFNTAGNPCGVYGQHLGRFKVERRSFQSQ